ncbi:STAS domain-containing protein [Endozoicomonas sp. SM1973]|uniref:Anti-sigma factor antagonist n=1 Tax=Spartinivicinus marinus TaxID=2994442 RepID=A0A853I8B4_9GAMM|nr:STAS domain-containing protein [Spartinivicinus marinus]MCX4026516.1 STAS domain-containing protein [Spartinivicinus marinus]NYZ66888.1 STAS domain-containing protein [Spartinivicinus marinus]
MGQVFRVSEKHSFYLVKLHFDLDYKTSSPLMLRLNRLLADLNKDLVIDLSTVSYIDSAGLRVLLCLCKLVRGQGRQAFLMGLNSQPYGLIKLTKMAQHFHLIESVEQYYDICSALR